MNEEFKLGALEIKMLEEVSGAFVGSDVTRIKNYADELFSIMEQKGINPQKRLAEIASQEKYGSVSICHGSDWRFYGDYYYDFSRFNCFSGGFESCVFENLLSEFGFYTDRYYHVSSYWLLPCFAIGRAMRESNNVNLYMQSIISAAEKVSRWTRWEKFICETIKQFSQS